MKQDTKKTETEKKNEWAVHVKGEKCSTSWEISVIRTNNHHGYKSWGWFDANKILISQEDDGCEIPMLEFLWDNQMRIAQELCDKLNSGEIEPPKNPAY